MPNDLSQYRKKARPVVAVQINLATQGLDYEKWGGPQHANAGDWLVDNAGEVYTVEAESFEQTYGQTDVLGQYVKVAPVWAREAKEAGSIKTKEGETAYAAGDMLVFNNPDGTDGYAMSSEKFRGMYEPAGET